jgi:hypothetical protein
MGKLPDLSLHFRDLLTVHKSTERILIAQGIQATAGRIVRPSRRDAPGPSTMAPFPYTQPDKRSIIERCQLRKRVMAADRPARLRGLPDRGTCRPLGTHERLGPGVSGVPSASRLRVRGVRSPDRGVRARRGDEDQEHAEQHGPHRCPIGLEALALVALAVRTAPVEARRVALRATALDRDGAPPGDRFSGGSGRSHVGPCVASGDAPRGLAIGRAIGSAG